jgi:hypothetical protein
MKLVALVTAVFALALPAAAATRAARVTVPDVSPFTVHGAHFVARERVTVVAQADGRHVKTVTASAAGAFTAKFLSVELGACAMYFVRATGSEGSRATLKVVPECANPVEPAELYPIDPIPHKR